MTKKNKYANALLSAPVYSFRKENNFNLFQLEQFYSNAAGHYTQIVWADTCKVFD